MMTFQEGLRSIGCGRKTMKTKTSDLDRYIEHLEKMLEEEQGRFDEILEIPDFMASVRYREKLEEIETQLKGAKEWRYEYGND